jgi:hypothetical protein
MEAGWKSLNVTVKTPTLLLPPLVLPTPRLLMIPFPTFRKRRRGLEQAIQASPPGFCQKLLFVTMFCLLRTPRKTLAASHHLRLKY